MRPPLTLGLAALALLAPVASIVGQEPDAAWYLEGLRTGFCIQLLLDPASEAIRGLPSGFRAIPASEIKDLHPSLRDVVTSQPEFAAWSPSRLCFHALDTIRGPDFTLKGKPDRPYLFATWTVKAATPSGEVQEAVLSLITSSGRLAKAADQMGQEMHGGRLRVGKVPVVDEDGIPSSDDRFEVKIGKTLITWDGRLARDTIRVAQPVSMEWSNPAAKGGAAVGEMILRPLYARAMVGALKVDGKDAFAQALRGSPTRFAGPAYEGGEGVVRLRR